LTAVCAAKHCAHHLARGCAQHSQVEGQDGESWELSKENYVPVRTGRKKAALAELTDPADSHTKHNLELKRR